MMKMISEDVPSIEDDGPAGAYDNSEWLSSLNDALAPQSSHKVS